MKGDPTSLVGLFLKSCLIHTLWPTATIPTIGDALETLDALHVELSQTLKQISDISAELAARDHIAVDNIQEVHSAILHDRFVVNQIHCSGGQRHTFVSPTRPRYRPEACINMPRVAEY
jgi:hypothetical protein